MTLRVKKALGRKRRPPLARAIGSTLFSAFLALGLAVLSYCVLIAWDLPADFRDTVRRNPTVTLLASDGAPFASYGPYRKEDVTAQNLPQHVIDALVSMEDKRFYSHFGIDPLGILRAAWRNLEAGKILEGGSTLTQQLAKNLYLGPERTFERKLQELILALRMEANLSKEGILLRYLNSAYFGSGVVGLSGAADLYFAKPVKDLTVREAALLVGLLKAPTRLNPLQNPEDALARADLVIAAMVRNGKLPREAAQAARTRPIALRQGKAETQTGAWFAHWIALTHHYEGHDDIALETTLSRPLQNIADKVIEKALASQGKRLNVGQAALVAMHSSGPVLAMVGGRDRRSSAFNRAFQALRQPGSAFKLPVYLAAFRAGYLPDEYAFDERGTSDDWLPRNYTRKSYGYITLREAFAKSINTIAVRIARSVGLDAVMRAARDLGIESPLRKVDSLALGTSGVTLLELTGAYASVASGMTGLKPFGSYRQRPAQPLRRLHHREMLVEILRDVVERGTGGRARLSVPAYGKTGTSQDYRDAWFIGFAGDLVVGVWVGNDDNSPMKRVTGGSLPARIWHDFMTEALPLAQAEEWPRINGLLADNPADEGPFRLSGASGEGSFFRVIETPVVVDLMTDGGVLPDDPAQTAPGAEALFGWQETADPDTEGVEETVDPTPEGLSDAGIPRPYTTP
ncbi:transglycosylase domain-containing protein [Rhizobiales bacterium]|uniref:transglycosylase domain-containing protein n=1 Tax=Hongsoonwoonella zoysiae TaxID=2821844 RepID=UPI0015611372|nr:transglycosylase domain-containing protein [Hongsoonwoonella zoysiae]NRG18526.1 transglycosylase domain-containing protein [Hongsoonwoonella zoysiae]